mmetsp:Transcript_2666/g.8047  ORF Transcript_2666/g.8047 Transcript_2666/m.8047 type:complete len:180 (+) Transcript_2666:70-609(+)
MGARCLQCVCFAAQKEEEQKIKDYRRSNLTRRLSQFNFNDEEGMAAAAMFVRSGAKLKFQNEFKEGFASNVLENGDLTTRNDDPCQRRPSHRSHQYLWHVAHPASEEHPCEQEDAETGADDNSAAAKTEPGAARRPSGAGRGSSPKRRSSATNKPRPASGAPTVRAVSPAKGRPPQRKP